MDRLPPRIPKRSPILNVSIRLVFGLVLVLAPVAAAAKRAPEILAVDVVKEEGKTRVEIELSRGARYRVSERTASARVVIDIPGARFRAAWKDIAVGTPAVARVRGHARRGGAELVLDLNLRASYTHRLETGGKAGGKPAARIVIEIVERVPRVPPPGKAPATPPTFGPPAPAVSAGRAGARPPAIRFPGGLARMANRPAPPHGASPSASSGTGRVERLRIVIDAGHGGDDPGAKGPRGFLEKDLTLRVARAPRTAGARARARGAHDAHRR